MNIKALVSIEVVKNDKTFSFHMPSGIKYGEAYDAAFEVLEQILELSKQAKDAARREDDAPEN